MMTGLRELKKSQTRRAIVDAAWDLFRERGFDDVTVDEIAQRAQVSKKTVFNYFPSKEDLAFANADFRQARMLQALERAGDQLSLVESFRELCLAQSELIEELRRRALGGSGESLDLIHSNPALLRRLHENNARLAQNLADGIASRSGRDHADPVVVSVAASLLGAQTALFRSLRARVASGSSTATIRRAHRRDVNRVFDLLAGGLDGFVLDR